MKTINCFKKKKTKNLVYAKNLFEHSPFSSLSAPTPPVFSGLDASAALVLLKRVEEEMLRPPPPIPPSCLHETD